LLIRLRACFTFPERGGGEPETPMKNFLAIYMGSADGAKMEAWRAMDETTRKAKEAAGMKAWIDWDAKHKDSIVVGGGPLGKTKRTGANGIADIRNAMTGYIVVRAESHEAAAKLFENHPHFTMFPGDSVEIMEEHVTRGRADSR
jgi:hypothetical protein